MAHRRAYRSSQWRLNATSLLSLALILLLLVGCAPISPDFVDTISTVPAQAEPPVAEEPVTEEPADAEPADAEPADAFAGDWAGVIAIAGIELPFDLHIAAGDDGYSATLDIPMQGAMGLPVEIVALTPENVEFTILAGPNMASFTGTMGEDGVVSGDFLQAGQAGTFTLTRGGTAVEGEGDAAGGLTAGGLTAGVSSIFTDTTGLWSVPVPTGWTLTENEGYVTLSVPDEEIAVHLMALAGDDPEAAIAEAWQRVQPGFDLAIDQTMNPPGGEGIEAVVTHTYETGDRNKTVVAAAQVHDGINYISLFELGLEAMQRRSAQISIIDVGFRILGADRTDLTGVEPAPLSDEIIAEWEEFVETAREKFEVPGAIIGVVRDGELVYANGFGYADPETQTPMTPETRMMIGSTGKSLTTMLMGTLVDDGLMTWDTPAQELYPDFAVMDPALSESITMRNLVCACTGVPRRDLEFIFNANELTASDVISSLRTFEFFTDFGEAFQYSNQMVATGGYIAGLTATPEIDEPMAAYETALRERVTGPIGMDSTTLSFDEVMASGDYAVPHGFNLLSDYVRIPITVEKVLLPVAPAGSHWSTLDDMAKYMVAQLSDGVAPNGERVISEENLLETRIPQVEISADAWYGLGWMMGDYKGVPMFEHGGNTLGFTSDFAFLPDADLGIIVLTNGQVTNTFSQAARVRLLEMLYDLPSQVEPAIDFTVEQVEAQSARLAERMQGDFAPEEFMHFVGHYNNPTLGALEVRFDDAEGVFAIDFGEASTPIQPFFDDGELEGFFAFEPPLAGLTVRLEENDAGEPTVIIGEGLVENIFTPATE